MSNAWSIKIAAGWGSFSRVAASYGLMTCVLFSPPVRTSLQLAAWRFGDISTALSAVQKQTFTDQALKIVFLNETKNTVFTHAEVEHFLDVRRILLLWTIFISATMVVNIWAERQFTLNNFYAPDLISKYLRFLAILILCATILIGIFFSSFFEMFHQLIFVNGNYSFPASSIMIQLFPPLFWLLSVVIMQLGVTGLLWWQSNVLSRLKQDE